MEDSKESEGTLITVKIEPTSPEHEPTFEVPILLAPIKTEECYLESVSEDPLYQEGEPCIKEEFVIKDEIDIGPTVIEERANNGIERRRERQRRYWERNREAIRQRNRNYYSKKRQSAQTTACESSEFDNIEAITDDEISNSLEARKKILRKERDRRYREEHRETLKQRNKDYRQHKKNSQQGSDSFQVPNRQPQEEAKGPLLSDALVRKTVQVKICSPGSKAYTGLQNLLQTSDTSADDQQSPTIKIKTNARRSRESGKCQALLKELSSDNHQSSTDEIKIYVQHSRESGDPQMLLNEVSSSIQPSSVNNPPLMRARKRPKTPAERQKQYRHRQKKLKQAQNAERDKPPKKTRADYQREYRSRRKLKANLKSSEMIPENRICYVTADRQSD